MNKVMDARKVKLLGLGLSCCFLLIHITMFLLFRHYGVTPMVRFNVFSIVFYLFSLLLLKRERLWIYSVSVYLEVVLHMTLAVIFVGADSGFQVTLIGMNALGFYAEYLSNNMNSRHVSGIVLSSIGMLMYLGAYVYSQRFPAAYELPREVSFWLQIAWGVIIFAVNIFFLKVFVMITLRSERVLSDAQTQANSMITALASDYRSVYYVNLDENKGICYRSDPTDKEQTPEGVSFSYLQRFSWYGRHNVAENYREGFMSFIDPVNIRESLATKPVISYRYLARRAGREYYEMIRMAGVRRVEDRNDHMVHSIGLGISVIDEEMRETMSKNEALAEALSLAEEANKAKTAFLSSMSHEIRTPMNAIIGLDALALRDTAIAAQTREYLEKIGGSAKHLLALINDILDMSRIESGRMVLRREEFSFSAMLEQINTMVMSQCSDKGLSYECRILSRVDDNYIGDDMKLKEVLINILSNAIKFTNAPGSVTMTVERTATFEDQSTLRFRIKDTGIGMDKAFIPKIYDTFTQEDSSSKTKYGSTGLGMAITKNLVEMMNGTIDVESEKGVGTEFTVTITLRNCENKAVDREDSIDPNTLRVLVVDDDEIAAEHARMVLNEVGIRTDICTSGEEALKMMEVQHTKHEPYNLVLMDWEMPEMNGLETTERIRKQFSSETTVVVLTAYNWDEIQKDALRAGVDTFLAKPLFVSNVIEEFERVARRNNITLFKEKKRAELAGRRILLAEDMEINAEIMMDVLEMQDVSADHAGNGRIAVEMFDNSAVGTYSAILMDVRMPEMDGLEAAAAIRALDREDAKRIPIIALTANAFDEDVQRSLQAGMNAHLSKPVEPEHLFQTLGELIYESEAGD